MKVLGDVVGSLQKKIIYLDMQHMIVILEGSANGYSSVEYSIYYHSSQFISKGYLDPVTDGRYFGANLGDKGSGINVK